MTNTYKTRRAILTGHLGKLEQIPEDKPIKLKFCPYIENCTVRKVIRDLHQPMYCFNNNIEGCRTYQFYKKYPNWMEMGIGSRL